MPQQNCLVSTSIDKTVREFDLRVPVSLVAEHSEHKRSVLALACSDTCVYTGGEDKKVCVWDRRSQNILQTVKVRPPCGALSLSHTHTHTHGTAQLAAVVSDLHCGYGKLSCSGQKKVTIFNCTHGTLAKLSVSSTLLYIKSQILL